LRGYLRPTDHDERPLPERDPAAGWEDLGVADELRLLPRRDHDVRRDLGLREPDRPDETGLLREPDFDRAARPDGLAGEAGTVEELPRLVDRAQPGLRPVAK
jgi:hypothetical protein